MPMRKFPFFKQADYKDCGPTCLRMIAKHYGNDIPIQTLRDLTETTRDGSSMMGLSDASEKIGFHSIGIQLSFRKLSEIPLPSILHWNEEHFVVLYKIKKEKSICSRSCPRPDYLEHQRIH